MCTEVTKFKVSDFAEKVKDKIKASFVDLIPEEKWDELVKRELDLTMVEKTTDRYGNSEVNTDGIYYMIGRALKKVIQEKIDSEILPMLEEHYDSEKQKNVVNDMIKKMIVDNSSEIFANIMGRAVADAVSVLRDKVSNNCY